MSVNPILQILATAAPAAVPEIVKFLRAESDHKPVELLHLPDGFETELALYRAKARAARAARPDEVEASADDDDSGPEVA